MRFLAVLLILLSLVTLIHGDDEKFNFKTYIHYTATVRCNLNRTWCAHLRYWEDDIMYDDDLHGDAYICTNDPVKTVTTTAVDVDGEGLGDNTLEPYVHVIHNCTHWNTEKVFDMCLEHVPSVEAEFSFSYDMDITERTGTLSI